MKDNHKFTRRDFIKGAGTVAIGAAVGLPALAEETEKEIPKTRVVLVRDENVLDAKGNIDGEIIQKMLDEAVTTLYDKEDAVACWKKIIKPDDIVGIKTNVWRYLATPKELENAIKKRVLDTGVKDENIGISDRGVRNDPVFQKATALINTRPMRTHAWSGVGSLLKNQIMFAQRPSAYHDDSCADLATLWELPQIKGKTRLNVLVMFTPLFHGVGSHHFNKEYVWSYKGLVVSFDPVAADSVGLQIIRARRKEFFKEDRPLSPHAKHIEYAETRHHLGVADPSKIELIRLGYKDNILI